MMHVILLARCAHPMSISYASHSQKPGPSRWLEYPVYLLNSNERILIYSRGEETTWSGGSGAWHLLIIALLFNVPRRMTHFMSAKDLEKRPWLTASFLQLDTSISVNKYLICANIHHLNHVCISQNLFKNNHSFVYHFIPASVHLLCTARTRILSVYVQHGIVNPNAISIRICKCISEPWYLSPATPEKQKIQNVYVCMCKRIEAM